MTSIQKSLKHPQKTSIISQNTCKKSQKTVKRPINIQKKNPQKTSKKYSKTSVLRNNALYYNLFT
jgi:hypothetical protein